MATGREFEFDQNTADRLADEGEQALRVAKDALVRLFEVDRQIAEFFDNTGLDADEGDYERAIPGLERVMKVAGHIPIDADLKDIFPDLTVAGE